MATTVARLQAVLSANTRDFDQAMNRSESKMHKVGRVAGLAGAAIGAGLVVGLEKSVKAAIHAQVAEARLEQSFKNAHVAIMPLRHEIDKLEASGRKLGFTDEQTKTSLGSLITATHNMKLAAKDLAVAQDLSRFKHVDLADATKMLTMAMTGSQRAAKQLGISVSPVTKTYDALKATMGKTIDAHEKMELAQAKLRDKQLTGIAVVDAVRDHVKGQAKAYSETASGAMEFFRAEIDHLEVALGNKLLPAMMKAVEWIKAHWPEISRVIGEAWAAIKPTLVALGTLVASVVETIRRHWGTIGPIVMAVVKVVRDALAILTGIIKVFAAVLRGDWSAAWNQLKGVAANVFREIRDNLVLQIKVFAALGKSIGSALAAGFKGAAIDAIHGINSALQRLVHWLGEAVGLVGKLTGALGKIHVPHINLPNLNPFGDGDGPGAKGGSGAAEGKRFGVGPQLWDEIGIGERFGLHVTSGYRPGAHTKHGTLSDHARHAAVDMSGSAAGMAATFMALVGRREVRQAFYDPLGSIFSGVRSSYREGGHSDHIHIAEADTGFLNLRPGWNLTHNGLGRNEPLSAAGGDTYNIVFPNYVGNERELESHIQRIISKYGKRNATPFGSDRTTRSQFRNEYRGLQGT